VTERMLRSAIWSVPSLRRWYPSGLLSSMKPNRLD
jgi:hypothetical protein